MLLVFMRESINTSVLVDLIDISQATYSMIDSQ